MDLNVRMDMMCYPCCSVEKWGSRCQCWRDSPTLLVVTTVSDARWWNSYTPRGSSLHSWCISEAQGDCCCQASWAWWGLPPRSLWAGASDRGLKIVAYIFDLLMDFKHLCTIIIEPPIMESAAMESTVMESARVGPPTLIEACDSCHQICPDTVVQSIKLVGNGTNIRVSNMCRY